MPNSSAEPMNADAAVAAHEGGPHEGRAVALHRNNAPALSAGSPESIMLIMERMAKNKEVDTTKLAQIREFGEAMLADQRRTAFDAALAAMQPDLPTITARGTIEIRAKTSSGERDGKLLQSTKYAKWEDINDTIKPVLSRHGFNLRFETGLAPDGRVMVTGILSGHGHREQSVFVLPHDATGSKNAVQAIGSSTSYGKRYAASALLNITSRGEDDDGVASGEPVDDSPRLSQAQIDALIEKCEAVGCTRQRFLKWVPAERFEDIPAHAFDSCVAGLNNFGKSKGSV